MTINGCGFTNWVWARINFNSQLKAIWLIDFVKSFKWSLDSLLRPGHKGICSDLTYQAKPTEKFILKMQFHPRFSFYPVGFLHTLYRATSKPGDKWVLGRILSCCSPRRAKKNEICRLKAQKILQGCWILYQLHATQNYATYVREGGERERET